MSQKKNSAKVNLYDKEFPSLSDTNVEENLRTSADTFSYSARLKTVLLPEVSENEEVTGNKRPFSMSASKVRNERPDKLYSTKEKRKSYDSPSRTFRGKNTFSKNSASHVPLGDCSETKSDTSATWTVVKKKRANQSIKETFGDNKDLFKSKNNSSHENSRQKENEFTTKNLSNNNTMSNNDRFRSKNFASHRNNRQNWNEFNSKDSSFKETLNGNDRFKSSFSDKHSFRSKSSLTEHKKNNVTQSRSKADLQNNIDSGNYQAQTSALKVSHERNFITETFKEDNSEKHYRNNEKKRNVSESLQKGFIFNKQRSAWTETFANDKLLNNQGLTGKYAPRSASRNTDPGHFKSNLKSCLKQSHIVPGNKQVPYSKNSNTQKLSAKPEFAKQNESIGVKLEKTTKSKRKSKLKRQAGLQRDKVQLISHNMFDKILKLNSASNFQTQRNVTLNIGDTNEYPELNATSDGVKQYFYSEVVCATKEVEKDETNTSTSGSSNNGSLLPCGEGEKKALSDVEEGTSETEKLALRHNDPITISLFDIITTNKTKKKHPDKNSKFLFGVPASTTKGKRSALLSAKNIPVNPLDSSKPAVKRGKEREKPKLKKPSHLKKIILLDRMKRKERIKLNQGGLFGREDTLNVQSVTNFDDGTPILTSQADKDQVEGCSNLFREGIIANSMQTVSNDVNKSQLLLVESLKESSNNFAFNEKSDPAKDSMIAEDDTLCIENYSCHPKIPFGEGNDSYLQNYSCDSKCHGAFQKDDSFLQKESCHSNNQLNQSDSSFNEIVIDVKWLFGYCGQCFHRVSQAKCLACANHQGFEGGVLTNRNQKNVSRYRKGHKFPSYDAFLYNIRYMFASNSPSEVIATEAILSDIRYLFMKENCSNMRDDDAITSSDCDGGNCLSTIISDRLEIAKHNSSATINDNNVSATLNDELKADDENLFTTVNDKMKVDDENLSATDNDEMKVDNKNSSTIVIDNLNLSSKVNTCDTNLDMACFSSHENQLVFTEDEVNKINISLMTNEIAVLKMPIAESNKTSDCSSRNVISTLSLENVEQSSPAQNCSEKEIKKASLVVLHSKKFREYCDQFLDKNLDEAVSLLLDDLARFQDRMHQKDPVKARMKRRLVYGIREIKRHMKLKKLKCIIIASDIEDSRSEGGLNDNLEELKSLARDFQIPCVFSQTRRHLGKRCRKSAPVSAVGIFNYDGSEENFKKMLMIQRDCKLDYAEAIKSLSSRLTYAQVELLCQTKEENPANIFSVNTKLLKEFYPPVKLIDSETNEDGMLEGNESNMCEDEKVIMYNILVKYKIINY